MSVEPDKNPGCPTESNICSIGDCDKTLDNNSKDEKKKVPRSVRFPADEQIVTQYFEPANPWHNVPSTTRSQLAAEYLESCRRHNTPCIDSVLEQIRELPETSIGGSIRAPRLTLSECALVGAAPADALEAVLRKVQFRRFEVDHAVIDDEGAEALFDMIEYYESATIVCISGPRQFGIRGWQAASRMIKKSAELSELEVTDSALEACHAPVLARSLRPLTCRLRALCLQRAELCGEPLLCLVIALKSNSSIRELRLGDNRLSVTDATQLASLLRYNNRIQLLDLSNNEIQDAGVCALAEALGAQAPPSPPAAAEPHEPHEPRRCQVGGHEARGLAFLVLWNNQLTRNCAPHISKVLRSCTSLCVLNIGRNAVGSDAVRAVGGQAGGGGTLVSLGLQCARLGPDAAHALADLIRQHTKLQRLDLRENRLGSVGLQAILTAMMENTTLTQIDLDEPPESTNLLAEDSETALVRRLTLEIRTLCRRNEPPTRHDDHPVHRKISLTCNTGCLLRQGVSCEEERRGRLRSPAPSPAPSPAGSPVPAPSHYSRFMVTRVTPERESSTESCPSTPTRPTYCHTPSRFRVVQVLEPPQIQVHPASTPRKTASRFSVTRNYDSLYNPSPSPPSSPATSVVDMVIPTSVSSIDVPDFNVPSTVNVPEVVDVPSIENIPEVVPLKDENVPAKVPLKDEVLSSSNISLNEISTEASMELSAEKNTDESITIKSMVNVSIESITTVSSIDNISTSNTSLVDTSSMVTAVSNLTPVLHTGLEDLNTRGLRKDINKPDSYVDIDNKPISNINVNNKPDSCITVDKLENEPVSCINIDNKPDSCTTINNKHKDKPISCINVDNKPISNTNVDNIPENKPVSCINIDNKPFLHTDVDNIPENKPDSNANVENKSDTKPDSYKAVTNTSVDNKPVTTNVDKLEAIKLKESAAQVKNTSAQLDKLKDSNKKIDELMIESKSVCSVTQAASTTESIVKTSSITESVIKEVESKNIDSSIDNKSEIECKQSESEKTCERDHAKVVSCDLKYSDVVKNTTKIDQNTTMKQIVAITEDLGNIIKEMKILVKDVDVPIKDIILKKNKSESSLDSPDLEVSRLTEKMSSVFDSNSSLEISGSSMESLNEHNKTVQELDRRKTVIPSGSSLESDVTPVNNNLLNLSVSSNDSVSPIFGKTKQIHDSLSSLEASVSSLDSGKQEKLMVTSADSGIEYSLQNPNEYIDNSSNEGTLTNNSSLKETVKKDIIDNTTSPKRTSSLLDVPALKNKGLDRMRKISWVPPSSSFQIPKPEDNKPSHLEKLLSIFQHPSSIFSRSSTSDDEKKSASSTPPRKDSSLTSSFWSWGSTIERDREEDSSEATDSTLSERVQVSFVDESFSKKLDSKTPSTDTDNTLSEFQSFPQESERVTVTTENTIVQKLDLSVNSNDIDIAKNGAMDLEKESVNIEQKEDTARPRSFAAVLKSSGSENSLDKQNSPDNGQPVDKLPSKVIRGIKENISPENTLTSSMTNTKTLAEELERQVKNPLEVAIRNELKVDENKVPNELAPIATIEETDDTQLAYIDDVKVDKDKKDIDLGKDALSYLMYENRDFDVGSETVVNTVIQQGSLAQELKEAEIKEILDLSPELVIDTADDPVFKAKEVNLRTSPIVPAKLKKSNSLEDLSLVETEKSSPKAKMIVFKIPESTTPRDIPERRVKLRTRSGSSPKSLPESLNKPCPISKMESVLTKKKKKVSSLGKMARDSLLALNMSEEEIAEFRRSYKLTSVESLKSLESVSEDANSQSGNSVDSRCRACLRTSQESLMSLDSITEDCRCTDDCEKPSRSAR